MMLYQRFSVALHLIDICTFSASLGSTLKKKIPKISDFSSDLTLLKFHWEDFCLDDRKENDHDHVIITSTRDH